MNLNLFNERSPLYDIRWFIIATIVISGFMLYHDLSGGRMFTSSAQKEWSSQGAGYHK